MRTGSPRGRAARNADSAGDAALQTDPPASLDQVFVTHAAKLRVVPNEIGQLAALLDEVGQRQPRHLLLELGDAKHLGENQTGVIEAQRLVEVGGNEEVSRGRGAHSQVPRYSDTDISASAITIAYARRSSNARKWLQITIY